MICSILDWKCIFVNELAGSIGIAVILLGIAYFMIAGKMKIGFDSTIVFGIPILLIGSLMLAGFQLIYAFLTFFVALLVAYVFSKIIGNR